MNKTFRTAGDLGDIIYSLPVVRHLGGGTLFWHGERWTRVPMTEARWEVIASLLEAQEYLVNGGQWKGQVTDINLNDFRARYFKSWNTEKRNFTTTKNLCQWICETHFVPTEAMNGAWLAVAPERVASVVINRTPRYQNHRFPWARVLQKYHDRVFVGLPEEHAAFESEMRETIRYHPQRNLHEVAGVIAGADLFIGNQSVCYALAEAMKVAAVLEVCRWLPNCLFYRDECWHGWDEQTTLPDL